jgi:hypothetical protein
MFVPSGDSGCRLGADYRNMSSYCEMCDGPLESPLASKCAACEIKSIASAARSRMGELEPWERLPDRWRRLAEGWTGFSEELQAELRDLVLEMYESKGDESLGRPRYDGRLAPRTYARPDLPLDVFDDPVAEEWADAG